MAKVTAGGGYSNQHEERTSVNDEGNPVSVLEQVPIDAGEAEEGSESPETPDQGEGVTEVPDEVPAPPEVPQEPVSGPSEPQAEPVEDDAAKAARLQAELDALKGGN